MEPMQETIKRLEKELAQEKAENAILRLHVKDYCEYMRNHLRNLEENVKRELTTLKCFDRL